MSTAHEDNEQNWVDETVARNGRRSEAAKVATEEQLRPHLEALGLAPDYVELFCQANRDLMRYFAGTGVEVTVEHLVSWLDARESEAFGAESWSREMGEAYKEAKRVAASIEMPVIPAVE